MWLLRLAGVMMLLAVPAVVMPFPWMDAIHRQLGLGALPHTPIVGYLTRSCSALYAVYGALMIFLSLDVVRYLPAIRFLAIVGVVFGVAMAGIDWAVGMPFSWAVSEGPWVVTESLVFWWLAGRVARDVREPPRSAVGQA